MRALIVAEILGASLCVGLLNYLATQWDFSSIPKMVYFCVFALPLSITGTLLFSFYYNHADAIPFASLMIGAYAASFIIGLVTQTVLLNDAIETRQIGAFVLFGAAVAVLAMGR